MPYQNAGLADGVGQSIEEGAERFGQRTLAFEQRLGELQASRRGGHLLSHLLWIWTRSSKCQTLLSPPVSDRPNSSKFATRTLPPPQLGFLEQFFTRNPTVCEFHLSELGNMSTSGVECWDFCENRAPKTSPRAD